MIECATGGRGHLIGLSFVSGGHTSCATKTGRLDLRIFGVVITAGPALGGEAAAGGAAGGAAVSFEPLRFLVFRIGLVGESSGARQTAASLLDLRALGMQGVEVEPPGSTSSSSSTSPTVATVSATGAAPGGEAVASSSTSS